MTARSLAFAWFCAVSLLCFGLEAQPESHINMMAASTNDALPARAEWFVFMQVGLPKERCRPGSGEFLQRLQGPI